MKDFCAHSCQHVHPNAHVRCMKVVVNWWFWVSENNGGSIFGGLVIWYRKRVLKGYEDRPFSSLILS